MKKTKFNLMIKWLAFLDFKMYKLFVILFIIKSKKCSFFRKIWRAFFSCYLRFEICLFTLLPTKLCF